MWRGRRVCPYLSIGFEVSSTMRRSVLDSSRQSAIRAVTERRAGPQAGSPGKAHRFWRALESAPEGTRIPIAILKATAESYSCRKYQARCGVPYRAGAYGRGYQADLIVARVLDQARPGSIILLHVMYGSRAESRAAMPGIIDGLQARGYRFVTISELLADS